jgi:hypothetical protein
MTTPNTTPPPPRHATARTLIYSLRGFKHDLARCCSFEFEDAIGRMDHADLLTTEPAACEPGLVHKLASKAGRIASVDIAPARSLKPVTVERNYDLFFFLCQSPPDFEDLAALRGWRERCRFAVCWIEELWVKWIREWPRALEPLKQFDLIFVGLQQSVPELEKAIGQPCRHILPGVDALRFCPFPLMPRRRIDVLNIGRRAAETHEALLELAARDRIFYFYDTIRGGSAQAIDPAHHRRFLADNIQRCRYFLANRPKIDTPSHTGGQDKDELGFRFFEGAAGGAVMLGDAPRGPLFQKHFDWPDAVIDLPWGSRNVAPLLDELDRQPERLARVRRDNVVNALLRHDWAYRWEALLAEVGLPTTESLAERKRNLAELAEQVRAARFE